MSASDFPQGSSSSSASSVRPPSAGRGQMSMSRVSPQGGMMNSMPGRGPGGPGMYPSRMQYPGQYPNRQPGHPGQYPSRQPGQYPNHPMQHPGQLQGSPSRMQYPGRTPSSTGSMGHTAQTYQPGMKPGPSRPSMHGPGEEQIPTLPTHMRQHAEEEEEQPQVVPPPCLMYILDFGTEGSEKTGRIIPSADLKSLFISAVSAPGIPIFPLVKSIHLGDIVRLKFDENPNRTLIFTVSGVKYEQQGVQLDVNLVEGEIPKGSKGNKPVYFCFFPASQSPSPSPIQQPQQPQQPQQAPEYSGPELFKFEPNNVSADLDEFQIDSSFIRSQGNFGELKINFNFKNVSGKSGRVVVKNSFSIFKAPVSGTFSSDKGPGIVTGTMEDDNLVFNLTHLNGSTVEGEGSGVLSTFWNTEGSE